MVIEAQDPTRQVLVIHLSDIHFGAHHRFNPAMSPSGDVPDDAAFPSLLQKLLEDLAGPDPGCPVIICLTGDLTETGSLSEFEKAESFIEQLSTSQVFGTSRGIDKVFAVPGNHDVAYASNDIGARWQQWTEFYNRSFNTQAKREDPWALVKVHDRTADLGLVVACLNSSIYVEKDKPDEDRGRVDLRQLTLLEDQLQAIDPNILKKSIRLALLHHHPILIPQLAEPGRGYDAVHNSGTLLAMLRRYGFHLVLHGHKHNPHTFTDDTRPAHQKTPDHPIFIAAGGSVGSTQISAAPGIANCYNRITIKWHAKARQSRVRVETRGLSIFNDDGTERLPTRWNWQTMRVDDRYFYGFNDAPDLREFTERQFNAEIDKNFEDERCHEYERTRGNVPVVQIQPSLQPGQAYEALVWLEYHPYGSNRPADSTPSEVTWSAGPKFELVTVSRYEGSDYAARFTYWGPMLVQARMTFPDGQMSAAYVYARMPRSFESAGEFG